MSTFCGLQVERFVLHVTILTICVNVLWFTRFFVACHFTDDMIVWSFFLVTMVYVACRYTDEMCQRCVVYKLNVLCCMSLY